MFKEPGPLTQIAIGAGVSLAFFCTLGTPGCGAETLQVPPHVAQVVRCKLAALEVLPEDPRSITSYDLDTLAGKLRACHAQASDGGTP